MYTGNLISGAKPYPAPAPTAGENAKDTAAQDGLIVRLLRAHRESRDVTAAINLETLADGVDAEERVGFLKEI